MACEVFAQAPLKRFSGVESAPVVGDFSLTRLPPSDI
jgi:hypothetical protein